MKLLLTFLIWTLLLVLCWPLALLILVLWPFLYLLCIPFRIVGALLARIDRIPAQRFVPAGASFGRSGSVRRGGWEGIKGGATPPSPHIS